MASRGHRSEAASTTHDTWCSARIKWRESAAVIRRRATAQMSQSKLGIFGGTTSEVVQPFATAGRDKKRTSGKQPNILVAGPRHSVYDCRRRRRRRSHRTLPFS